MAQTALFSYSCACTEEYDLSRLVGLTVAHAVNNMLKQKLQQKQIHQISILMIKHSSMLQEFHSVCLLPTLPSRILK
jgi:hypothetical protein